MQNQKDHTDLFDRYLNHQLTETELSEFDESLLNDEAFNAEFIAYKTLVYGIRDYGKTELKNYLKTHAKVAAPKNNFTISRALYAIAAVLIVFCGIYIVNSYYGGKLNAPGISTTELKKESSGTIDTNQTIIAENEASAPEKKEQIIEKELPAEASANDNVPPATADLALAEGKAGQAEMDDAASKEDLNYKILSDYKTGDTVLLAVYIQEAEPNSKYSGADKETLSKKALPSASNNNYNKNEDRVTIDTTAQLKQKKSLEANNQYTLEFWKSPVNFRGYKMNGKTIQLYGISNKNIRLASYNNNLYLRSGTNIYQLNNCPEGCLYKPETNETTLNLLLKP